MARIILLLFVIISCIACSTSTPPPPAAFGALPTDAQLKWQEMEMYCIIHFGVDTYTDKEWGYGDESPELLNPSAFSAEQIVGAAKAGGFKGVIVVAKHHDGLCLWPTKTTEHNISAAPWKGGKGDMVKEFQLACEKLDMKLGLYCSPWDRNSPEYGTPAYVALYREQLRELYANYGTIFTSWHDGANGGDGYYGGARETRNIDRTSYYGWDSTFRITRAMQPSAVIFGDIGPDVRWVGNEEGFAGETSWSTYTPEAREEGKEPANGFSKYWLATEGTRNGKYWMPAECDVPLRPGWFYHASQDEQVKSPAVLLDLYYKSVGRNAALDLGLSPDKRGILHENDVKVLQQFGALLKETFAVNLAATAKFSASNMRGNSKAFGPSLLVDNDRYSYWATDDSVTTAELIIDLPDTAQFNVIRLRENIKLGQRITSFAIDQSVQGQWKEIAGGTTIGGNRLLRLSQPVRPEKLRLRITGAMASITLSDLGLFNEVLNLSAPEISGNREGYITINTAATGKAIYYTTDGTEPTSQSSLYQKPFYLPDGGMVKAKSIATDGMMSSTGVKEFGLPSINWAILNTANQPQSSEAVDQDPSTLFAIEMNAQTETSVIIDTKKEQAISAVTYLPRQDRKKEGIIDQYKLSVSSDGKKWQEVTQGEFANIAANPIEQVIRFSSPMRTRFIRFEPLRVTTGSQAVIAELGVRGR
ncbi:alpha-L-fucosidase [Terrimonas sp. NA20]|uniref:alpha-L-fucosidase n=1 Tax=Terrimonas ginsenosidimutans TaxID=2908004 RepID=A0ABS9KLZ4_9BACT|nr:alpha-L-fucosidase [Terrimonas ginsenosidimutans]MCG2613340.1 alpha-L-fucosidase [Terrimonas ginsenosidimutans]